MIFRNSTIRAHSITWAITAGLFGAAVPALGQGLALEAARDALESPDTSPAPPEVAPGKVPEGSVGGMGDINIYPRRIVLDRRQRVASIGLYNKMPYEGEYEISVVNMIMTESGEIIPFSNLLQDTDTSRVKTASDMLRWSPRRVILPGSEAQTVRIMARPALDLPDGEYRAHLTVVALPGEVDEGFSIDDALNTGDQRSDNVGVTIRPRFGISIPVIFRVGETTLEVGLQDFVFSQGEDNKEVAITITRNGTRSAYGDVLITAAGQDEPLAMARGIGVYPEIAQRELRLAINPAFQIGKLKPGTVLTATFIDDDVEPGKTLARQTFVVP